LYNSGDKKHILCQKKHFLTSWNKFYIKFGHHTTPIGQGMSIMPDEEYLIKGLKIGLTWSLENLPSPLFAKEG
jgi:hypothetical protein